MNKTQLFRKTVGVMADVEQEHKGLSGVMKKKFVLLLMKTLITKKYGERAWEDHEDLIHSFIEIGIGISKKYISLNFNKKLRAPCC